MNRRLFIFLKLFLITGPAFGSGYTNHNHNQALISLPLKSVSENPSLATLLLSPKHYLNLDFLEMERSELYTKDESSADTCTYSPRPKPIRRIPETNLFTGIYYKITNKVSPNGSLVWTNSSRDYVKHLVSTSVPVPVYMDHDHDHNHHWKFSPTESEEQADYHEWYEWVNRGISEGIASYGYERVGNGYQISIITGDFKCKFLPGREFRQLALFKPMRAGYSYSRNSEWYKIVNGFVGQLTWGWTNDTTSTSAQHYIQADDGEETHNPAEMLFKFTPVNVKMSGRISKFSFKEIPRDFQQVRNSSVVKMKTLKTLKNPRNRRKVFQISQKVGGVNRFSYRFTQNINSALENLTMILEPPEFAEGIFQMPIELPIKDNLCSYEEVAEVQLRTKVEVPPMSKVDFTAHEEHVEDLFLQFEAMLEVEGSVDSDQAQDQDQNEESSSTRSRCSRAPAEFLLEELKSKGFFGDVMSIEGNTLGLRVAGGLKMTFDHKGYFQVGNVKYLKSWRKPKAKGRGLGPDRET